MTTPYTPPNYTRGSAAMDAASINNTIVTSSQVNSKIGGGTLTIQPMTSTTNTQSNYHPSDTYTKLSAVSANAQIQAVQTGGFKRRKSKRRKSKKRKSKRRKSKRRKV